MNLYLYNNQLEKIAMIESYTSLIWVKRYNEAGEFELYLPMSEEVTSQFENDFILKRDDDDSLMIIEKMKIESSGENGDFMIVSGQSIESLLARRISIERYDVKTYSSIFAVISELLNDNIGENATSDRKLNITWDVSDYEAENPIVSESYYCSSDRYGVNIYDYICEICDEKEYGFEIGLDNGSLHFFMYEGINRSKSQSVNPYVEFSPNFDNLISSEYSYDSTKKRTFALIGGEGEGFDQKEATYGSGSGLNRKEIFIDAKDIKSEKKDGQIMTEEEYTQALQERGISKLEEYVEVEKFSCEIDTSLTYKYKVDFYVGDIITAGNQYGMSINARIKEMNEVYDENGHQLTPTLEGVEI